VVGKSSFDLRDNEGGDRLGSEPIGVDHQVGDRGVGVVYAIKTLVAGRVIAVPVPGLLRSLSQLNRQ
jgi:hypothetical protein